MRYGVDPTPEKYHGHWYRTKIEQGEDEVRTYEIRDVWDSGYLVTCEHLRPDGSWVAHGEFGQMRPTRVDPK